MYPSGDLPGNLAAFCGTLRRQHGFRIGPGELRDAARTLEVVDISDQRRVRHALRATLASNRDQVDAFDDAFDAFFFPGPTGVPQSGLPALNPQGAPASGEPPSGAWRPRPGAAPT
ncbi:MAG: hypothetical protein OEW19_03995, partial [Acidobacteriota bacterium]|nr:hypothetical protein [Acidobacteriota bacterium]